jgi:hypothetical protein
MGFFPPPLTLSTKSIMNPQIKSIFTIKNPQSSIINRQSSVFIATGSGNDPT